MIDARMLNGLLEANIDPENIIILAEAGSNAHGTFIPSDQDGIDDIDFLGIYLPPAEEIVGLRRAKQTWTAQIDELDMTFHTVEKAVHLWIKSNPNILGLLWQENSIIHTSTVFQDFIMIRDSFASRRAFPAFAGYASSQMRKMQDSTQKYQGYMGERRKRLVDEHGYDTKNACHLIRLLRMCEEFMKEGVLYVDRTDRDADELIAIKQGRYDLPEVLELAHDLLARCEVARDMSKLSEGPDIPLIETTMVRIHREYLRSTN